MSSSLSSTSLDSYNYQQDDDDWLFDESIDRSSNLTFTSDAELAQNSDTSSLDQTTNNRFLSTNETQWKPHDFNDCFKSQEAETVNKRNVFSPLIEASVNQFSTKEVFFKGSDSCKDNVLSKSQPSVDMKQFGKKFCSVNCQVSDQSVGFMDHLYNQGKFWFCIEFVYAFFSDVANIILR